MCTAASCIVKDEAWICGGETPDLKVTHKVYSWKGPGTSWVSRPDLPEAKFGHSLIYDGDETIYALSGALAPSVHMYKFADTLWSNVEPLSPSRWCSGGVRHDKLFFVLGGEIPGGTTNTILVFDTTTGMTRTADTKLPANVASHCVAIIKTTTW